MSKTTVIAEPGTYEMLMERVFDATRERVFRAHTDPQAIPQWWGPSSVTTIVDKMEPKKGGSWRFLHRGADGTEYGFNGVFHECTAPERIVQTWEFEGMPGHVMLETLTFEEQPDGTTKLRTQSIFQSVAARDGMLQHGAAEGAAQTWDRLAELLAEG